MEATIDGFLKQYKAFIKKTMEGSGDDNEVNKSEEFEGNHYFEGGFCLTGVSGSCMIPSLVRSASHLIPGGICRGYLFPLFRFFRHFSSSFGLIIIINYQSEGCTGNWDETLPILQLL